jgi:GNAT superfamily N-acetyltransferase
MWRPERAVHGPFPVEERDVPSLNRLFADAFTDRYRRDGLVGVRVPFLNEQIWRYAIADAAGGAMLWRDESDRLVAFNIAHRSGTEGWMGPLCVRPDRQLGGLGREIVLAAADWLKAQGVTTLGLETMPRTVDNIGFYSRLGFLPGHLTLTMTTDTGRRGLRWAGPVRTLGSLAIADVADARRAMAALLARLQPGVDFAREVDLTLADGLGDVVLLERDGALAAYALCHAVPLAEGSARDEARALKVVAVDLAALLDVLGAASEWSQRQGARRLAARCQTVYRGAYAALAERGWRVRWSDLRMTLAGYPERMPEGGGIVWSNWEI